MRGSVGHKFNIMSLFLDAGSIWLSSEVFNAALEVKDGALCLGNHISSF